MVVARLQLVLLSARAQIIQVQIQMIKHSFYCLAHLAPCPGSGLKASVKRSGTVGKAKIPVKERRR